MASAKEISLKIKKIKQNDENKKCFECGEKGTSYVCTNFGTFICSRCAGVLRELNFKVKGIGLAIFNEKEMEILEKNGNEIAKKIWLAKYKKGKDIKPSLDDDKQLKDFLSEKYIAKNIFKEASYQELIDINKIENKESQLREVEFGLIPNQLMIKECPKKKKKNSY